MGQRLRDTLFLAMIGLGAGLVSVLMLFGLPLKTLISDDLIDVSFPVVRQIENFIADLRVATLIPHQEQHKDIVIVTVTEDTLAQFPYRSPINRAFLAGLVATLERKGAKAIGIDVIFDTPTEEQSDLLLREVLQNAKIPIVMSYGDREQIPESNLQYMNAFLDGLGRGYANVVKDGQDGVIRYFFPGKEVNPEKWGNASSGVGSAPDWIYGLPGAIAKALGHEAPRKYMPLVYHGYPEGKSIMDPFRRFPSHVVDRLPDVWFKDKIVMIGAELTDIDLDLKLTPWASIKGADGGLVPGVFIHAHALAQILDGTEVNKLSPISEIVMIVLIGMAGAMLAKIDLSTLARLSIAVGAITLLWLAGFLVYYQGGPLLPLIAPTLAMLAAAWVGDIYVSRQDREQKKFIKDAFSRYLPPALVDQMVQNPDMLNLSGERREMTFLFTDVAGFTTISESLPPSTLVHVLNRYMDGMSRIVLAHGGTIDKFIGDAVFAIFGAPVHQPDHAQRAVATALEMDRFAQDFFNSCTDEHGNRTKFGITRIGVHTGEATVGNFGSELKFDYTALGDAVNAAARMEGLNKYFGTRCAITIETAKRTTGFHFRPIGSIVVKGKTEPIDVFTPVPPEAKDEPLTLRYNAAYEALARGDQQALGMFLSLAEDFPDDPLVKLHAKRIAEGLLSVRIDMQEK